MDLQLGYNLGAVTVKVQQEVLEAGFNTPLATLHAFNGWADRFLTTPVKGLADTNIKLLAKYAKLQAKYTVYAFRRDELLQFDLENGETELSTVELNVIDQSKVDHWLKG